MSKDLIVLKSLIKADYERHIKKFSKLEPNKEIVFLGDSMIAYFPLKQLNLDNKVHNLGIPGDTTTGVLNRIEQVIDLKPKKVLLHIGLNDYVLTDHDSEQIYQNILNICYTLEEQIKNVEIYLVNLTPINKSNFQQQMFVKYRDLHDADELNELLMNQSKFKVFDLFNLLVDDQYELKLSLTKDGIHLNEEGYKIYLNLIEGSL